MVAGINIPPPSLGYMRLRREDRFYDPSEGALFETTKSIMYSSCRFRLSFRNSLRFAEMIH